jgi:hypothetical protein
MLTKRPLLDIASDQWLLILDESRRAAVRSALQSRHTLIVGEVGSGKTTVLRHVKARAEAPQSAVFIDARLADDARILVDMLLQAAADVGWVPTAELPRADDPFGPVAQIRRLREAPSGALVLLDDPDPGQSAVLFGRMRDELWQLPVWFTVAINPASLQVLSRPPADAFFDSVLNIAPLDPDAAFELLRLRKERGEIDQIIGPPRPAHPRAILLDAEAGPAGLRYDAHLQHERVSLAEREVGRPGAMLFAEIWNRGAVSASDADLQRQLGVSRARLTQLLKALERCGVLVVTKPIESGRPGRPKTFYDINLGLLHP